MTEQLRSISRKVLVHKEKLRRELGAGALFSTAYGNVGSSIYYGIGATVAYALGATPLALMLAGIFFIFTILTFSEAATMMPYAGGTAYYTRKAFNESVSFFAGWVDLLAYVATIALSSITAVFYLAHFLPFLKEPVPVIIGTLSFSTDPHVLAVFMAVFIVMLLAGINIIGVKEAALFNMFFAVIDLITQALVITIGIIVALNIDKIVSYAAMGPHHWPTMQQFIYGVAIAMVAFTGIETIAQMAEETEDYKKKIPKAYFMLAVVVLIISITLPSIAVSLMEPPVIMRDWQVNAIAGVAFHMPDITLFGHVIHLKTILGAWISFIAVTILLMATNAGIMGVSRLSYSMGQFRQIPSFIFKLHRKFNTPHIAIGVFSAASIMLILSGIFFRDIFLKLASIYCLASVLIFALAHLSVISLRIKSPEAERPFRVGLNFKFKGKDIPITAVIGFLVNIAVWLVMFMANSWTRVVAIIWVAIGFGLYIYYRKKYSLPLMEEVTIERVVEAAYMPLDYYDIIVPTLGELDASMIQTAAKIALRDKSNVLALYIIEVPMTLPLDARMQQEREKAEKALDQAEMIGKEYGINIQAKIIQARLAGKTIVDEAARRRAGLILMGQSEKTRLSDIISGKTVSYVAQNAPCRVFINIAEKA
ncbi:MAG TPA: universal stress protein [bacterium]|nr:universal stress protein [bacterium]